MTLCHNYALEVRSDGQAQWSRLLAGTRRGCVGVRRACGRPAPLLRALTSASCSCIQCEVDLSSIKLRWTKTRRFRQFCSRPLEWRVRSSLHRGWQDDTCSSDWRQTDVQPILDVDSNQPRFERRPLSSFQTTSGRWRRRAGQSLQRASLPRRLSCHRLAVSVSFGHREGSHSVGQQL